MMEKFFARFLKQKTRQFSSRRPTKSSYCPIFLRKKSDFGFFLEKRDEFFLKKTNEKFRKRVISQVFLSKCVSNFTTAHEFSRRSNFWVFWEKRWFLFENILQLFKNTQHRYFPSEGVLEVLFAYAISKRSNLEIFPENDVFFLRKNPWKFSGSLCMAFLSKKPVRFSNCLGKLKTIKFLDFLMNWMLFFEKI